MKAWKRIEPTVVSKVGYRTVISKTFVMPDGSVMSWDTLNGERARTAATIALTPDNQVIIAYQYRPGVEDFVYEIPGGAVDNGEEPAAAALRELEEESGYTSPNPLVLLGTSRKDAYTNSTAYFYMATGCMPTGTAKHQERGEFTETMLISVEELIDNARNNRMTDMEAVFFAYEQLLVLQGKKIVKEGK